MIPPLTYAGKSQTKPSDQKSASDVTTKSSSAAKTNEKSEPSPPIAIPKEKLAAESQATSSNQTDGKKTKKVQQKDTATTVTSASTSPAHGLAALKNLIAKAAAGTLSSKSSSNKIYADVATKSEDKDEYSKSSPPKSPSGERANDIKGSPPSSGKTKVTTSTSTTSTSVTTGTSTSTSTSTATGNSKEDVSAQENDYWMEEKLKMQNTLSYQSFQKGAMLKKNLTSKGTSPPPQTISTQVKHLYLFLIYVLGSILHLFFYPRLTKL